MAAERPRIVERDPVDQRVCLRSCPSGKMSGMDAKRTYPSGVPCWIDTEQPDPEAASRFYGELFGWTFEDAVPPGVPGSYLIAQLDRNDVGAVAPATSDGPAQWNTYIAVDDADAIVERIVGAGGQVTLAPESVGGGGQAGRNAFFVDPEGVPFRVWQPGRRLGTQIVNVPGAWNFSDLHTADLDAAKQFYADVFGWVAEDAGGGPVMWRRLGYGDHLAATIDPDIYERQAKAPPGFADCVAFLVAVEPDEPPHWHVTFAVADRDEMVETALRLGATDESGPVDTQWTKAAVVRDPQGATFTLSQFAPQDW